MHQPQLDVADAALAERLVGLLDREIDKLALDVGVVARRLLRVGDDDVDDDVVGLRGRFVLLEFLAEASFAFDAAEATFRSVLFPARL